MYRYLRIAGHVAAIMVIAAFVRGLMIFGGEVSTVKTVLLTMLLFSWLVVLPIVKGFRERAKYQSASMQTMSDFQLSSAKYVFPLIVILAFLWRTFTTWRRPDREYGLRQFFREWNRGAN